MNRERTLGGYREKLWLKALSDIKRYIPKEKGHENLEMIHQQDVWIHSRRVMYLAELLAKTSIRDNPNEYQPNIKKILNMGYHHDDPEILTGDFLATEKRRMSKERLQKLADDEDAAASAIAHFIFGLKGPEAKMYVEQQREIREKQTLESQIVDVADKWDAACEIMHEVRCGNISFASLLSHTKETFEFLSAKYPFYESVKNNPRFNFGSIPDPQQVLTLPTITIDDLKTPKDLIRVMSPSGTKDWPNPYKVWAILNLDIFYKNPEKFIFPGWYIQLWNKWKRIPPGTTTASGFQLP